MKNLSLNSRTAVFGAILAAVVFALTLHSSIANVFAMVCPAPVPPGGGGIVLAMVCPAPVPPGGGSVVLAMVCPAPVPPGGGSVVA
jgi:hypothetical protein